MLAATPIIHLILALQVVAYTHLAVFHFLSGCMESLLVAWQPLETTDQEIVLYVTPRQTATLHTFALGQIQLMLISEL